MVYMFLKYRRWNINNEDHIPLVPKIHNFEVLVVQNKRPRVLDVQVISPAQVTFLKEDFCIIISISHEIKVRMIFLLNKV